MKSGTMERSFTSCKNLEHLMYIRLMVFLVHNNKSSKTFSINLIQDHLFSLSCAAIVQIKDISTNLSQHQSIDSLIKTIWTSTHENEQSAETMRILWEAHDEHGSKVLCRPQVRRALLRARKTRSSRPTIFSTTSTNQEDQISDASSAEAGI